MYSQNTIRIIGGKWRHRKLSVINSPGLRPTTNRMRETLFNWLTPVIQGSRCLDCFAGSGALGLEALSRSAESVIFLEKNYTVYTQLFNNIKVLKAYQAKIIFTNSLHWIAQRGDVFDIVFIDPPFYQGLIYKTVSVLEQYKRLKKNAWIYIETEIKKYSSLSRLPRHWQLYRKKKSQQVIYRLYKKQNENE